MWPHASVGVTLDGLHFQVIGLPAPRGLMPVIAKYAFCGGPWGRPSGRLCRLNPSYGPLGVEAAALRGGVKMLWDGAYSALMPYIEVSFIEEVVEPWSALERVARGAGIEPLASAAVKLAAELTRGRGSAGLTGSLAMGVASPGISDIDLVVDEWAAEEVYARWRLIAKPLPAMASEGGTSIDDTLEWRRGVVNGSIHASWIAAPRQPASHCPPLLRYPNLDQPRSPWKGVVTVEPGQLGALLYPPCIETEEGYWLVSYEYNVARLFYEGGLLEIHGLKGRNTVYLAARPVPGSVRRHRRPFRANREPS